MSDSDLDKYLEGIGINVGGDEQVENLPSDDDAFEQPEFQRPVYAPEEDDSFATAFEAASSAMVVQGDPAERAESFLVNLLLNIDPAYAVEIDAVTEDEVFIEVFGGDPGKIIGRGGRTLSALEYVTNAVVNREEGRGIRINVDVGGYKRRRDERLREAAFNAAARVRKSGHDVEMEPMSAAERRVVHMALAEEPDVITESSGEGPGRRVVVKAA
ncbi:MAG TPA: R3H domain-containing nucleic acid-binding protein [Trueperaceae bacterium]|nr:R3H domain-containing nucleic acid-binding protein [Trueperaceae bacterium]